MRRTDETIGIRDERHWLSEATYNSLAHIALPDGLYLIPGAHFGAWAAAKQLGWYMLSLFRRL